MACQHHEDYSRCNSKTQRLLEATAPAPKELCGESQEHAVVPFSIAFGSKSSVNKIAALECKDAQKSLEPV